MMEKLEGYKLWLVASLPDPTPEQLLETRRAKYEDYRREVEPEPGSRTTTTSVRIRGAGSYRKHDDHCQRRTSAHRGQHLSVQTRG